MKQSGDKMVGFKGLGIIWSCKLVNNLGHLWLASGHCRGGKMNETASPEEDEVQA